MTDQRVIGLSGGGKQLWLKQHRTEVLAYLSQNGPEATREQFLLKEDTLERFLTRREVDFDKMTKADRALAVSLTSIEMSRDNKQEISQLRQRLEVIEPAYQVMLAMGVALKAIERLPGVTDFLPSEEKRA